MTTSNTESPDKNYTSMKCDTIEHLPTEILQKILLELSHEDLRSAISCCKRWRAALNDDWLWEKLCQRECYVEMKLDWKKSEFYTDFLQRYNNYWEGVYWYNYTVQRNWETYTYKKVAYKIKGPHYDYANWFFLKDLFIIMNLFKTEMYVYNLRGNKLVTCTIDADTFNIKHISKSGNYLFEFIQNRRLTVWRLNNGSIVFRKFLPNVARIYANHNLIVLYTPNEKFEVCNIETNKFEYERRGIFNNVGIMNGRIIFAMDQVIHILKWDDKSLVTLTCCKENQHHTMLLVTNNRLLSFCKKGNPWEMTLCIWNIATKTKIHSISLANKDNLRHIMLTNKYLYVAKSVSVDDDDNNYINYCLADLWDYNKGTLAFKLTHITAPNYLRNQHCIIACISFKIVMFCFRTRDYIDNLNLPYTRYQFDKVLMTNSKLAHSKDEKHFILLHVMDFEV